MSLRTGFQWYSTLFGPRGLATFCAFTLFGRPTEIRARPHGIRHPVHVRIKTADELVYRSVLLESGYSFKLPFSPRIILDAGANIGTASIYFANLYPEAKIVAIEPEESNFSMLVRNVRPYPSIVPIRAALWNRDGEISVSDPDPATGAFGKWGIVTREGTSHAMVRALTMQTLLRELSVPAFDLIKMDIEGAEQEVFQDTGWLTGVECLMVELHDRFRPGCTEAVESAMLGFNRSHQSDTTFYIRQQ